MNIAPIPSPRGEEPFVVAPASLSSSAASLALPLAPSVAPSRPVEPIEAANLTRVLLVDDDEDEWLITRDLLREVEANDRSLSSTSAGKSPRFSLDWVSNFDAGLETIGRAEHDVYLVDYRLGTRSGLDLVRQAMGRGVRAPLILLTGQGDPDVDAAATEAGAADYLLKDGLDAALLERAIRYSIAQKRTQEELRQAARQNERLSAAIAHAEIGVMIAEVRHEALIITFANPAFEAISGTSLDAILGQPVDFLKGANTDPENVRAINEAIAAGWPYEDVVLNYRGDGGQFWNAIHLSPVLDPNGRATTWIGFIRDVSARIEAERALRESEENLAAAQRLTHFGSWNADLESETESQSPRFTRLKWSDEVFRILGLEQNSVQPTFELYHSLLHPDDLALSLGLPVVLTREGTFDQIYRVMRPGGEERVVHIHAEFDQFSPPNEASSRCVIGTLHDITERTRAENLARESQERLQMVVENAPLLIWSLDTQGQVNFIQGRALEALKLRPEELLATSRLDNERVPPLIAALDAATGAGTGAATGTVAGTGDADSDQHNGQNSGLVEVEGIWFETKTSPLRDAQGQVTGLVGVATDVSERVRAQRLLDESEARLTRIVSNAPGMVYRFHRTPSGEMSFSDVSEGCREIYGIEPQEVLRDAQVVIEVVHPDDVEAFFGSISTSEHSLEPWNWEGRIFHRNGATRWVRGQARPLRQTDGSTAWDGLLVDITQSHQVQEELVRSRNAFDEAQQLALLGSFECDLATSEMKWSDQVFRLLGHEPRSFVPTYESALVFVHPDDYQNLRQQALLAIERAQPTTIVMRVLRRDGTQRIWQMLMRVETSVAGRPVRLVGSVQDVTENLMAEQALRESEQRYALAAQGANDGLWDWNLQDNQIYLSPRWKMMLGYAVDKIGEDPEEWFSRVHPDDIDHLRGTLKLHLGGESPHFECQYRLRSTDGTYLWMLGRGLAVTGESGVAHRIAGSQTDISQRKNNEAQLKRHAFYDALTGLPNRALFLDRLERTLSRAGRNPAYAFAVLFLDIDRFKKINDSLGHLPGDQLLIQAAARFETCLRPGDTVARLGGDEFAILLDDITDADPDAVNQVAARIQKELEAPFSLEGKEVFVTVSIGIAPSQGGEERPDELLRNADTAMYRAKSLGRARHEMFDATMHQRAVKLLELETDLWRAVERDELRLFYQPIVSLAEGTISGFEALLRWQHPERGLMAPGDFIPLAEESGLIVPIGWWVLERACRQAQLWRQRFAPLAPYFMSVNLSSKQFSENNMIECVRQTVRESEFDPHFLKLEITESVIMENTDSAALMLMQLKALGIRLSMDDFGTGYSSLSYLHRFPLDTLKIDRSFVSQMRVHPKNQEIIGTIISLANGLSMNVVAEGVETEAQLHGLRTLGCGYAQGFHFARPLPVHKIEELLAQNPTW